MKITVSQLRKVIKEEVTKAMSEAPEVLPERVESLKPGTQVHVEEADGKNSSLAVVKSVDKMSNPPTAEIQWKEVSTHADRTEGEMATIFWNELAGDWSYEGDVDGAVYNVWFSTPGKTVSPSWIEPPPVFMPPSAGARSRKASNR